MLVWVIYDISEDRTRNMISRHCKNIGLYRVQKSVFLGDIEENTLDELKLKVEDMIDLKNDSVYIFPMSKSELRKAGLIGQAFNKELVSNELVSTFF